MILMPAWIVEEKENEYVALLGSEPKTNAEKEILPKDCVKNIIYATMIHESGYKFAMLTLEEKKIPEKIKSIMNIK